MVTGGGNRVLTMAAQHADIIAITSSTSAFSDADLAERIAFVREKAGDRIDDIELSFGFSPVSIDDPSDVSLLRLTKPEAPEAELRELATLIDAPVAAAAQRLRRLHDELGISYFIFGESPGTSWETFKRLIAALR
jgi:alkanesulfonate monooxygenase SsuD/methylene tetrahydromethanopterin reductase-like flavin-dependent oxidoreductase (luciferase family)